MAILSVTQYDLVITDFEMPGVDGYGLALWLRTEVPSAKVLIMTGRCQSEVAALMSDHVANGWLFKPFGFRELIETLS